MEILNLKVLKGPNYWSTQKKELIVIQLDLKEFEELPTNLIEGFADRLTSLMPSLYDHHCSPGVAGGFLERLKEGTWLGHVVEHVALELQCLAGMACGFGRTRSTHKKGIYHVVFAYEIESAGVYAAHAAINIVKMLAHSKPYESLEQDLEKLKDIREIEGLGVSAQAIVNEAKKRNIPYCRLDNDSLIMLGHGCNQKLICTTVTSETSNVGVDIAANKDLTKQILASAFMPVPKGLVINKLDQLDEVIKELDFPIVIKPLNGNHGRGITTNIKTKQKALLAFKLAQKVSHDIIVEHFVNGCDYRFLVINYKVVAVAKRIPASVTGNGTLKIQELIDEINQDSKRGDAHSNVLTKIKIDEATLSILAEEDLSLDTILPKGQTVYLKHGANISSGGTAIDVTELVHPKNILLAERVARFIHLDICGIDIVAEKIDVPIIENDNGAIIEVNAAPGIRMHLAPSEGKARNVAKNIVDLLYPHGTSSRIPLVAVTGTNGKTTTVRLIAHFAEQAGHCVGLTTTDGIYINHEQTYKGDCAGPTSARAVLHDPVVNFAVLECARGGIIRSGLGFDSCNISILINITADHLGLEDIESLEELARVKSVVSHSTANDGYAILNADDDLVYEIKQDLHCNIALFSLHSNNPRIKEHCSGKGLAAYVEKDSIIINRNGVKTVFAKIADIPLTHSGAAQCMVQNILPAVLAGIISGFKIEDIFKWVHMFIPSSDNTPGRMNLFSVGEFQVLVDYAHNAGAFVELQKYLSRVKSNKKIGIIGSPGDRRPEDIRNIGFYSAQMFDEIIIRHDKDGRGSSNGAITALLTEGIKRANSDANVSIISDEHEALQFALENAGAGTFIVHLPEDVQTALSYLKNLEQQHIFQPVGLS